MSDNRGLSEDEYLDIVENIQKAMMIEPFRPDMTDVVALIGAWRLQNNEIRQLRAMIDEIAAEDDE
jgi:hypothetical protein